MRNLRAQQKEENMSYVHSSVYAGSREGSTFRMSLVYGVEKLTALIGCEGSREWKRCFIRACLAMLVNWKLEIK